MGEEDFDDINLVDLIRLFINDTSEEVIGVLIESLFLDSCYDKSYSGITINYHTNNGRFGVGLHLTSEQLKNIFTVFPDLALNTFINIWGSGDSDSNEYKMAMINHVKRRALEIKLSKELPFNEIEEVTTIKI